MSTDQERLLTTAKTLVQPTPAALAEFVAKQEELAADLAARLRERPDIERLVGPGNLAMMEDNSRNFFRFMSSLFAHYEPEVLVQTVLWVFRAYRAHGFQLTFWPAELDIVVELLRQKLSPDTFKSLYPHYNWMIVNNPAFVALSDGIPSSAVPAH